MGHSNPGPGRLALRLYVVFAEPTGTAGARAAATDAHLQYLAELEAAGKLVMAGPFISESGGSTGGGMFILRTGSLEEAQAIAAQDPYNSGGYRTFRVAPWRLDQGGFSLNLSFSRGTFRIG